MLPSFTILLFLTSLLSPAFGIPSPRGFRFSGGGIRGGGSSGGSSEGSSGGLVEVPVEVQLAVAVAVIDILEVASSSSPAVGMATAPTQPPRPTRATTSATRATTKAPPPRRTPTRKTRPG